ncbi:hypothetical protein BDN72DRAFT_837534 [Pluteus cervinus]|uniref:Uncharacterized protein n=1 Tax=Pluteus cervinus TaxID=181527 RepID=A0ACD3B3F9_9AGAR|nr:hypothetical protein BDN72DRAFT_837534 [Pluteus cervinus]
MHCGVLDLPVEVLLTIVELVRILDHGVGCGNSTGWPCDEICPHNSLKFLSLVCSGFRPLAQREHFSHITIGRQTPTQVTASCNLFLDLLNRQPTIAAYIRGILLIDREGPSNVQSQSWISSNSSSVADLLLQLPNLSAFHLHTSGLVLKWNHIPQDVLTAMYTVLRLPSLTALVLSGFKDLPIDLLDHCPNLQELRLVKSYLKRPSITDDRHFHGIPRDAPSTPSAPQIRLLQIIEGAPMTNFPFGCLNPPVAYNLCNLESFHMRSFLSDLTSVPMSEFKHLKSLDVECSSASCRYDPERYLDLSPHRFLESLYIRVPLMSDANVQWLAASLRSLSTPHSTLRSITVQLRAFARRFDFTDTTVFRDLSSAFAKLHAPVSVGGTQRCVLQSVVAEIVLYENTGLDMERVRSEIAWLGCESIFSFRIVPLAEIITWK